MKVNILVSLLLFITTSSFSQQKFTKEFVVTSNSDTLYGAVSITKRKFAKIKFDDLLGKHHLYTADDVLSFNDTTWGLYVVKKVKFDVTWPLATKFRYSAPANFFLKVIYQVNGIAVYSFISSKYGERFFINKDGSDLEELISHERLIENGNSKLKVSDDLAKKILAQYMTDCPGIPEEINKTRISEEGLTKLFMKYASCRSITVPRYETKLERIDKGRWSWGILGAGFVSKYYYNDGGPGNVPFPSNSGFEFGISSNYLVSKRNKRSSIIMELAYKKHKTTSTWDVGGVPNVYNYDVDYLRFNSLYRYNFNIQKYLRPFLTIGISNSIIVANNSSYSNSWGAGSLKGKFRFYETGFILGAGLNYKKVDLFARFEVSNGWDDRETNDEPIWVKSSYFGLIYYFR